MVAQLVKRVSMNGVVVLFARGFNHTVHLRIQCSTETHRRDVQQVFGVRRKVRKIRPLDATSRAIVLHLSSVVARTADGVDAVVAQVGQLVDITEIGRQVIPQEMIPQKGVHNFKLFVFGKVYTIVYTLVQQRFVLRVVFGLCVLHHHRV